MKNLTIFTTASLSGASGTGSTVNITAAPNPLSIMLPVEISCSTTTPVVTIQGRLRETSNWSDLSSTVSGTLQLIPRCNQYRVTWTGAAGGESLTVTLGVL